MKKNVTLLYVDDEPINLVVFELNFKNKYNVITAESGIQGLKILDNNDDIIVVVSDMRMPEMNGIEFIKKAKEKHKHIAFYILTGFDLNQEISAAIESNLIQKYFQKPFNIIEIENAINEFVISLE